MSPRSTSTRRSRRRDVLATLKAAPGPMGIVQLAESLGVHANTVRFHLDTLVENGQAEPVEAARSGPGRPAALFRAVSGMDPGGPRRFRMLAEILTQSLASGPTPARRAVEAGRDWGTHLPAPSAREKPVAHLIALLDDLGFAPEQDQSDRSRIGLRHCPFLELAQTHASVVCPIHLGLMQGVMQTAGAPVTVEHLEPFVEPDLCMAHLSTPRSGSVSAGSS